MPERLILALVVGGVLVLVGAGVLSGSRARRALGVVIALSSLGACLLVPDNGPVAHWVRPVLVLTELAGAMRALDLARGEWTFPERIIHVLSIVDNRRISRASDAPSRPGALLPVLGLVVGWLAVAVGTYLLWCALTPSPTVAFWVSRWSLGLVFAYALSEAAYGSLRVGYRAIGFTTPVLHDHPAASRSVQEFWGERWNRIVGTWLRETFFRPFARRRMPAVGVAAAFAASALIHAYIAWVAAGGLMAALMFAYFLLQAVAMGIERLLEVRRWRPVAGHAWTIAWMVLLSPGFTEPLAVSLGFARP